MMKHTSRKSVSLFRCATALLLFLLLFSSCSAMSPNDASEGNNIPFPPGEAEKWPADFPDSKDDLPENTLIENGFIKTSEQPISTFSSDVDTASYTYFRKLLSQGLSLSQLIGYGSSFRTEEMVNYFHYDYASPKEGDLFGVTQEIAVCPWNSETMLMFVGMAAKEAEPNDKGNNLVFLIDVSGSMYSEDKLPLLQKSFAYLVDNLTEKDRISIVTYSGKEEVVLEACPGNQKEVILRAINSLTAGGSTNGESGLKKAYQIAASCMIEGGNNRILMASDGDLNVGISSEEELKNYISSEREKGIYLSVLGFGTGNYQDAKMETLADNGNGVYYYIDGDREAERIFTTDLLSTLYTVAEDVKLQITFNPIYVDSYRLCGYENRILNTEDFEDDTKDAGEVGSGHTLTVCYELKLTQFATDGERETPAEFCKLAVRWKEPGTTESILREYLISSDAVSETPSDDFRFIGAVIETAMVLHKSLYLNEKPAEVCLTEINSVLASLDLSDEFKIEFRELLGKLSPAGR